VGGGAALETAPHGALLAVDPGSIDLGTVTAGVYQVMPLAQIVRRDPALPLSVSVTGGVATILRASLAPGGETVTAMVYAPEVPSHGSMPLSGTLQVSIGNDYDSVAVPMQASVVAPPATPPSPGAGTGPSQTP
jgi:hypothetical protein